MSSRVNLSREVILFTLVLSTLLTSIWFYCVYPALTAAVIRAPSSQRSRAHPCPLHLSADSRGANCCLEIRTILNCDPVGECMGFNGDCGDIQDQFLTVQGPYTYGDPPEEHMYLDEYVCTQFPDDAYVTDQLLVGLISVAVALPVDLFLARAFELANENSDMPEAWVDEPTGKWKFLLGKDCHNSWRLADPKQPVSDLVLWLVRYSSYEPMFATFIRLLSWLKRKIRERLFGKEPEAEEDDDGAGTSASAEARAEAIQKRLYASLGLLGVYVCWTIFAWVIFTYGMLIYTTLGDKAQSEFAKTWGCVGVRCDACCASRARPSFAC